MACSKKQSRILEQAKVWVCPSGHWGRLDLLKSDVCPICKEKYSEEMRELNPLLKTFPFEEIMRTRINDEDDYWSKKSCKSF